MNVLPTRVSLLVSLVLVVIVIVTGPVFAQDVPPETAPDTMAPEKQETTPQTPKSETKTQPAAADTTASEEQATTPAAPIAQTQSVSETAATSSGDSFQQALDQLKAQLDAQNKQIEALKAQYASEVTARQKEIDKQNKQITSQEKEISTQKQAIQSLQQEVDQAKIAAGQDISDSEKALRSRLETVEQSIKKSEESESTTYDLKSFPGSIPIPGSSAAIKFGGFVKMNIVQSF